MKPMVKMMSPLRKRRFRLRFIRFYPRLTQTSHLRTRWFKDVRARRTFALIVLSRDVTLITGNVRDFEKIPLLKGVRTV